MAVDAKSIKGYCFYWHRIVFIKSSHKLWVTTEKRDSPESS